MLPNLQFSDITSQIHHTISLCNMFSYPHPNTPTGIGQAIAHHLLSRSHKLVLISRTHSALDQLHYQYGSECVEVLAGDVSDFSLAKKAVELAKERWGK